MYIRMVQSGYVPVPVRSSLPADQTSKRTTPSASLQEGLCHGHQSAAIARSAKLGVHSAEPFGTIYIHTYMHTLAAAPAVRYLILRCMSSWV